MLGTGVGGFTDEVSADGFDPSLLYEDSGVSLSYGLGAEVTFGTGAKWGFDFEYQRFMDVGDADNSGHEYDRDLISAGFHYRFGT